MKLLFDENMPRKLRYRFALAHEVVTVQELGWLGKENGELLGLMVEYGLQAIITGDKNMPYQQNWRTYPLPVLLLNARSDQYEDYLALMPTVKLLVPQVLALLAQPRLVGGVHVVQILT